MDYRMSPLDISRALRQETYLDMQGTAAGYRDLIPLLKVLRYKALHSSVVYESAEEAPEAGRVRISPMYWL